MDADEGSREGCGVVVLMADDNRIAEEEDRNDRAVMERLMSEGDQRPWSVDELVRDRDKRAKPEDVIDAIKRLSGIGLIHHTGDSLIFPTRAALHFDRIVG